tara:strand:+ start:1692 stop:1925 length:234 start_codon:yes stop_codon:yes gene_type:complete
MNKQISLTIPKTLFDASREYCQDLGYKTMQEFILDLMRRKVILENTERYAKIKARVKKGKSVKRFNQKDALKYVKGL